MILSFLAPVVLGLGVAVAPVQDEDGAAAPGDELPEPPEDIVAALVEAAGGREAWEEADGIRYDMLETVRILEGEQRWVVATRVPMLVHFDAADRGYLNQEYTSLDLTRASYRRAVAMGLDAWAEQGTRYDHETGTIQDVLNEVTRERFLGTMPFSLLAEGTRVAYIGAQEVDGRAVWAFEVAVPRPIAPRRVERVRTFYLFVDTETMSVVRLRWQFVELDRWDIGNPSETWQVDFTEFREAQGIRIPHRRVMWTEDPRRLWEWISEDVALERIPPAALRRPWYTGSTYAGAPRADFWDPPAEGDVVGPPFDTGGGGGSAGVPPAPRTGGAERPLQREARRGR